MRTDVFNSEKAVLFGVFVQVFVRLLLLETPYWTTSFPAPMSREQRDIFPAFLPEPPIGFLPIISLTIEGKYCLLSRRLKRFRA